MAAFLISLQLLPVVLFSPFLWAAVVLVATAAAVAWHDSRAASAELPTISARRRVLELSTLLLIPALLLACGEYFSLPRPPFPYQDKVLMALHGTLFVQAALAARSLVMSVFKGSAAELVGRERDAARSLVAACANVFWKRTALFAIAVAALAVTAVGGCAEAPSPQLKSIAWSPDSKHLLSGGYDGEVRVRDVATGKSTIVHRPRTPFINTVQWSPDGQRLLAVTDQTVELLDTHGKEIVVIVASPPLQHEAFPVFEFPIQIAFSPMGERLALAGWDDGRVLIVDARSGQTEFVFKDISERVSSISWAPNGKQLVAGAWDQTVRILDVEAGKEAGRMEVELNGGWVKVKVSPDGKRLAWHGHLTDIWLWDIEKGSERQIAVEGGTQAVAWSPDGKRIAALGLETLRVWNVEADVEEKSLAVSRVDQVLWSPDGQYIAALSMFGRATLWNVRTGTRRTLPQAVSLAFSPDMRFIASGEQVEPFSRF